MRKIRSNGVMTPVMEQTLNTAHTVRQVKYSLFWGFVNASILSVLLYDIFYTCPFYSPTFRMVELALALVFAINTIFHFGRYTITTLNVKPIFVTPSQKKLLAFANGESFIKVKQETTRTVISTPESSTTPSNLSTTSWLSSSPTSPLSDESTIGANYASTSWLYGNTSQRSPQALSQSPSSVHRVSPTKLNLSVSAAADDDVINDEYSLSQYLKRYNGYEKTTSVGYSIEQPSNLLSMFWSHPVTRSPTEATPILRRCTYQMAISTPEQSPNIIRSSDEPGMSSYCDAEMWRRNKINSNNLIQWTANLRMWISQTILERLVSEIKSINGSLQVHGFVDICIGEVGLDRLRKTAQSSQAIQNIPSLHCLVPFLEISPNQEYIVKRIKELSRGGCMSEFKWNNGGTLDGKEWGEHLPTDAALVLHLWATYLDSQLPPLPSMPDSRPFSSLYLSKHPNQPTKIPLAISQVTENPPHYQLVINDEIHFVPKGRNNLFYTILLFLHHIKMKEHGMLGRMNLGRSGVNMLWIIDN